MFIGKAEVPEYRVQLVRERNIPTRELLFAEGIADVLHDMLDDSPVEQFVSIYIDARGKMVGAERIAIGDLLTVSVSMRNIFRGAIAACVPSVIIGHNHPLGDCTPSNPDLTMTATAIQAGSIVGIEVRDHVIVSPNGTHFSMWDNRDELQSRFDMIAMERAMKSLVPSHPLVDPLQNNKTADAITSLLKNLIKLAPGAGGP